ncbi:hypothetical protein J1605_021653 [Eschrichtius robustus]|uniref:Uncharacterized protein n=1 Tax=Eschrichtius robustus TaxID=9764 RepID=A0AB34HG17_ESCRO|nr:hypothetical protein J1605_021653 [Eschrichtius robustus]
MGAAVEPVCTWRHLWRSGQIRSFSLIQDQWSVALCQLVPSAVTQVSAVHPDRARRQPGLGPCRGFPPEAGVAKPGNGQPCPVVIQVNHVAN